MERRTPVGLLVSVTVHIALMMLLLSVPVRRPLPSPPEPVPTEAPRVVVMVPQETLRELQPAPPIRSRPAVRATPPPRSARERISVGGPSAYRQKGPLELKRDEDLTKNVARGVPETGEAQEPSRRAPSAPRREASGDDPTGGSPLPSFRTTPAPVPRGQGTGPRSAGLGETLRDLDRRLGSAGPLGLESGTGQQMGPLFFDAQGADFTQWVNHFRTDVYRNWIVPYSVLMYGGEVQFEMTVERDGRVSRLHMVQSTGNAALDRSAQNALIASRFLPLPADFGPPSVLMRVSFFYGARPSGS